ncbi:MAG: adenosylcobinamide-phosphate synthase [Alphaproteobacteria bacterium]|jgi:adenosylcobinamide-phosphate synthase
MQPIIAVWLALVIEKLVPVSASIEPFTFFRFVCLQMANKVIKQGSSHQQLVISGSLALLVLLFPTLVIAYLMHNFASYQWLLDALLLWLLIQYTQDINLFNKGVEALKKNKKQLSKDLLQQKLLRNTQAMSPLGLTKASVESIFLRYHHQQFTTIACFLLLGPIAALGYRLCYEAHQVWNVKCEAFTVFGRFANMLTLLFQIVPSIVLSISFIIFSAPYALSDFFKEKQLSAILKQLIVGHSNQSLLLCSLAHGLGINIGGPVMYGETKYQRQRFTPLSVEQENIKSSSTQPTFETVKVLISLVNRHLIISLLLVTWIIFWFFPG